MFLYLFIKKWMEIENSVTQKKENTSYKVHFVVERKKGEEEVVDSNLSH